jgi:hypothetical protein
MRRKFPGVRERAGRFYVRYYVAGRQVEEAVPAETAKDAYAIRLELQRAAAVGTWVPKPTRATPPPAPEGARRSPTWSPSTGATGSRPAGPRATSGPRSPRSRPSSGRCRWRSTTAPGLSLALPLILPCRRLNRDNLCSRMALETPEDEGDRDLAPATC